MLLHRQAFPVPSARKKTGQGVYALARVKQLRLVSARASYQSRERLLVQAERNVDVQAYLRAWLASVKVSNRVRVTVDVDPVSFF